MKKFINYLYAFVELILAFTLSRKIIWRLVNYRAIKESTKIIHKKDIFLCDSGGQYRHGTTRRISRETLKTEMIGLKGDRGGVDSRRFHRYQRV